MIKSTEVSDLNHSATGAAVSVFSIQNIISGLLNEAFLHYENLPMQYIEKILVVKMKIFTGNFFIFFLFVLKT